jgi:hypothetical protein
MQSSLRDPYRILQVAPHAEIEVIEAAYRRLARKYHPDVDSSASATQRMQEINWAYEILSDPAKRAKYDTSVRSATPRPRPGYRPKHPPPSPRSSQSTTARSAPSRTTSTAPTPAESSPSFLRRYWFWIVLVIAAVYMLNRSQPDEAPLSSSTFGGEQQLDQGQSNRFADCIEWTQAKYYDGQTKCVVGRVAIVTYEFDDISGADIWTAHFSFNVSADFTLISVDKDISSWEGRCVAAYGTLFDRELIREYSDNPQPGMVDSDPFDERGFTIISAPESECR